jgi:tyrosyl-tRNA synthetase
MDRVLERGVEEIINKEHLEAQLEKGEKLRVKLGIDPTSPDLHLGHTVVLRKLRQFQDAGHKAVLIIGDFTATIGDPSGRSELRPKLSKEQAKENMKNYLKEAAKVLDIKKAEVRHNSEWYGKKNALFLFELASKFTVARALERNDFQKRIKEGRDVGLLEMLYPIFQGYDSVEIKADVELGGTDQKFNLIMGRKVQERYGQTPQDIITMPLIEGTDGVRKMSKSLGNYIGISEGPDEMFGKLMSVPDDLMPKYFLLLTDTPEDEIEQLKKDRLQPAIASRFPKDWKEKLALEVVQMYHGEKEAEKAKAEFERVFSQGKLPEKIEEFKIGGGPTKLTELLKESGLASSMSEAKRLIEQKAVSVNDEVVESWDREVKSGDIIKVGPRKFVKAI